MAFQEVISIPAIALGGKNKKTGKANLTSIEGYFLGSRQVPDQKKKSGFSFIHEFQTEKGTQPVWGKTDMDRKLQNVVPGTMTKVTATGKTKPTPNGDMQLYLVQQDKDNCIEVAARESTDSDDSSGDAAEPSYDDTGAEGLDTVEEETPLDSDDDSGLEQVAPTRAARPVQPAQAPSAARQASVRAALGARSAK